MGVHRLREEHHEYINQADERFLKMVYAMSKVYEKPAIVGYHVDSSPITQGTLINRARAASKRVKSRDFISQKEVEKDIYKWKGIGIH